jgi:coenzyme F420-reducing hydrogenase alpha subunit
MRAGTGVGAVEVPRGILYHEYSVTDTGEVASANCIIPTTQNNGNIHLDLNALVAELARQGASDKQIVQQAQMLVRAYDPCISCSVH